MIRTSGFIWASVWHLEHRINQPAHVDALDVLKACRVFAISLTTARSTAGWTRSEGSDPLYQQAF